MNKIFTSYLEKIEKSLQQIIPTQSNSQWNKLSFGNIPECVNNNHLANLLTPCRNTYTHVQTELMSMLSHL